MYCVYKKYMHVDYWTTTNYSLNISTVEKTTSYNAAHSYSCTWAALEFEIILSVSPMSRQLYIMSDSVGSCLLLIEY